jgi:hypothetical protein
MNAVTALTAREAVRALQAIDPGDQEAAHDEADKILLAAVPPSVRAAYQDLVERSGGFWYA